MKRRTTTRNTVVPSKDISKKRSSATDAETNETTKPLTHATVPISVLNEKGISAKV